MVSSRHQRRQISTRFAGGRPSLIDTRGPGSEQWVTYVQRGPANERVRGGRRPGDVLVTATLENGDVREPAAATLTAPRKRLNLCEAVVTTVPYRILRDWDWAGFNVPLNTSYVNYIYERRRCTIVFDRCVVHFVQQRGQWAGAVYRM